MTKTGFFKTVKAFSCAAARTAIFAAALAAGLFASAALSSCSNLEGDDFSPATQTAPAGTAPGGESVPASLKMGSVSGTIQQKEEQPTVARSVVPTVADVTGGIISYTVSAWGTKADGTVVPESSPITVDTTTTTFSLGLEYGTWTLRADAKDTSSNIIMTQTAATPITLDDSNPVVNLNFALDYAQISGTPGALSLTMAYATSVSKISYSLLKSNGTPVASGVVNPAPASSFTLNASQDSALGSLEPGDYQLVVEFLATDSSVLMRMDQAVQIYSNITTNKIDGVAPYINSGAVNVSADVIKKYQQSVVYVGGTGIGSGTAASDSNNGTQFDPVEHVERALEIIEASMLTSSDVPDGFKIFVQADTSLTGNLALSSSKKISIVGTNTSAYYKISGALTNGITASASDVSFSYINLNKIHGFDITGGQTTLKNCSITNGKARVDSTMIYASSGGGGGGICVKRSAKAILTDCSISGCSAESGGAVYVRDDSESGLAEVELTRCVLGDALRTSCASESDCSNKATGGGGGIYINKFGKATLNNTKIIGNVAVDGCGGAIYCNAATLAISGGQINYNHSKQSGGGIYVGGWDVAPGSVAVDGCVIGVTGAAAPATGISDCGNYCETYGSGAGLYIDENATLSTTSGFSVLKNYCGSSGGGFYNKSATATVLPNCDISYNACADNGGGIYNEGTLSLQGGTIAGNAAANNGGGVYLSAGAKLFVSGAAAIGQDLASTSSAATSASGQHSNTAVLGGGIYNAGELYLGYASGSTPSPADWTGSVCYNYASSDGGGVYSDGNSAVLKMNTGNVAYNLCSDGTGSTGGGGGVAARGGSGFEMSGGKVTCNQTNDKVGGGIYIDGGGTLALSGDAEVSSNKTSADGTGSMGGAGLFAYRASITMEGNAVVKDNLCKACGGGVYLFESENASSYASLAMSGNAKILENTSSDGFGGAVYVTQRCLFSIKEAAAIPAGVGGATGVGKNDVYLDTDTSINVAGSITSTTTPVAAITPKSPYAVDTPVLTGTALTAAQCGKFAVTQPVDVDFPWVIKYDSSSGKGVLKQPRSVVYVAADGDDGNDGTKDHPYATIQEAVKHFSDKTPSLGDTSDPGYPNFENKVYILSDMTFTDGAGADNNAYNFEVIACNDKTVGKNVTLTFNTPGGSGLYVAYGQKVKLTNIDITQSSATANKYAAIMVENNASGKGELWMENCSVKNMTAKDCSAIAAKNDVHLKNVTVTGNTTKVELASAAATVYGPAVYSDKGTIHIEGTIVVKDNTVDYTVSGSSVTGSKIQNVWIGENTGTSPEFHKLDITGALTGSDIGVTLYDNSKTFTSYFNSSGSSDPADFFKSDEGWDVVLDESGNAKLQKPTTIYVAAMTAVPAGSDIIGNGSALLPYATVQKAVSRIEELNDSTKAYTIQVGVGSFAAATCIDSSGTLGPKPIASRITIVGNSKTTTTLRKAATGTAAILSLVDVGVPITLQKIGFAGGDATGSGGAIDATRTSTGTFDLTITDCNFSLNKASSKGGAIYLSGSVSCTINDTAFGQNYTTSTESLDGNGGAIYVGSGASLYVGSSTSGSTTFTANTANNGGAIYNEGKCFVYGSTVIGNKNASSYAQETTTMHSNSATTYGGGIYNKGQLYLGYSSWTSPSVNTATTLTGGVYYNYAVAGAGIFNDTSSSVVINSGSVSKNGSSTTGGGGGLFNQGTLDITGGSVDNNFGGTKGGGILISAATTISGTASISENTATDGAGVYIYENKLTMNGGSVSSNIASKTGGGIYVGPGQTTDKGIFEFNDGTISENLAIQGAGVVDLGVMNMAGGTISQNQADGSASEACGGGVLVYSTLEDPFSMTGGSIEGNSSEGNGGGLYIYHGECSITNGTISGNTAATNGGGVYVSKGALGAANVGTLKLGDDAYIPAGTDGKNDVFLCDAIVLISSLNKAGPVATITPYVYDGTEQFLTQATPGLVGGNYDKFAVTPQTISGGVTKNWTVNSSGYLAELTTGGGSITIHTPEGDLNLAASATTIATSASSTTVKITATDASGSAITSLAWNGVTVYYGADEIDSKADTNSYTFAKTFPKGTYTLNVSVTYKGTTYSDSFTITKTVEGAVAVAMPSDFKKITAGSFKRAASSSAAAYTVTLTKDFYMCDHEVTQKEWEDVMGVSQTALINAVSGGVDKGTGDDYPVYYVNWYQAIAYCNKKSAAEGLTPCYTVSGVSASDWRTLAFASIPISVDSTWNAANYNPDADGYRLPTEAEWEYAALGDYKDDPNWNGYGDSSNSTVKVFAGYNGSNSIGNYAWNSGNAGSQTHETKTTPNANSYGLYDMSGNVFEWCWDWLGNYDSADVTDPIGASGSLRVNRGGSWASSATGCSVNNRDNSYPYSRNNGIGFRVVRNAP